MNPFLVLPTQVLSSKSFLSPRQLQLTLPSEVNRHRSWHPPLLTRHIENSPTQTWGKLNTQTSVNESFWPHIQPLDTQAHTLHPPHLHSHQQTVMPAWMWQWLCFCWMHNSMWLSINGICSYYHRLSACMVGVGTGARESLVNEATWGRDGWWDDREKNVLHWFKRIQTMGDDATRWDGEKGEDVWIVGVEDQFRRCVCMCVFVCMVIKHRWAHSGGVCESA